MRRFLSVLALSCALPSAAYAQRADLEATSPEPNEATASGESPAEAEESASPSPGAPSRDGEHTRAPLARTDTEAEPTADSAAELSAPQDATRTVLLLAPPSIRAEWTAALQIELAARGVTVVPLEPPPGPTSLIRDAAAQRVLLERGAATAILVVEGHPAHSVRVLTPEASAARVAPVAVEADPRTAALIAVSLWDEQPVPPAPVAAEPPWYQRGVAAEVEEPAPLAPRAPRDTAKWSFRVGTGVFGLFNNRRTYLGTLARVGGGVRLGLFEAEVGIEGGLMLEHFDNHGDESQPMVRGCTGAGFASVDDVEFHAGLRVCGGYAQAREIQREPLGAEFTFDRDGWLLDIGTYTALSFRPGGLLLFVRLDLGGGVIEAAGAVPRVSATLSTIVAVE